MQITKEHIGKRLLVKKSTAYYIEPTEANLLEVSPSGDYLKLEFIRSDSTTYIDWVNVHNYQLVEELGYKLYKSNFKDQSDNITVTEEQYKKESRRALEKELKKNKWVHGICNPPSPDWKATNSQKEYVECCKSTGKRYYSIKDMLDDINHDGDLMNKL